MRPLKFFIEKIGIWPIVERVAAQRNSVNRLAGMIETKPLVTSAIEFTGG
jgi:hypothetical protein